MSYKIVTGSPLEVSLRTHVQYIYKRDPKYKHNPRLDLNSLDLNRLDMNRRDSINTRQQTMAIWWLLIANNTGHMTRTNQWETRRMTRTTNQNMTQWTREPIAWIHEGKGSMKQTETMTKLQNKRHENMNIKQNPKPHFTYPPPLRAAPGAQTKPNKSRAMGQAHEREQDW